MVGNRCAKRTTYLVAQVAVPAADDLPEACVAEVLAGRRCADKVLESLQVPGDAGAGVLGGQEGAAEDAVGLCVSSFKEQQSRYTGIAAIAHL